MSSLFREIGAMEPDNLLADIRIPVLVQGVNIASGQKLKRGTCVGKYNDKYYITGKTLSTEATENATEVVGAYGILTDDVDSSTADTIATVYITGCFNRQAIIFEENITIDSYEDELRKLGIFVKNIVE